MDTGGDDRLDEGYQILAVGKSKYFDMAMNCARSIRLHDERQRSIQLIVDNLAMVSNELRAAVDFVDVLPFNANLPATLTKLRLWEVARFKRNLFVDADCLLMKKGISDHWTNLASREFAIPGRVLTSGTWYRTDLTELIKIASVPYIVQINSGVIYFSRTPEGRAPFETAKYMLSHFAHAVVQRHGTGEHGDEPFLGLALGALGHQPYPIHTDKAGSLMLSTINGVAFEFNIAQGLSRFEKNGAVVSPHIVHFVGLEPRRPYEEACQALRENESLNDL